MTEQDLAQAFAEFMSGRTSRFTVSFQPGYDDRDEIRRALGVRSPSYRGAPRFVIKKNGSDWALILTEQQDGSYTPTVERV